MACGSSSAWGAAGFPAVFVNLGHGQNGFLPTATGFLSTGDDFFARFDPDETEISASDYVFPGSAGLAGVRASAPGG